MTERTKHPGDFAWRLPLIRVLQQASSITKEQTDAALAAAKEGGLFVTHLAAAGIPPTKLLIAWGKATGLPTAGSTELRKPSKELAAKMTAAQALELLAVPFQGGESLHIAFAAPLPPNVAAQLPPHVPFVALESEVLQTIEYYWPGSTAPAAEPEAEVIPARFGDPTEADFKRAGLVLNNEPSRAKISKPQLKKLGLIAAAVLGVLLIVKTGMWIVERSVKEVNDKSDQLRKNIVPPTR